MDTPEQKEAKARVNGSILHTVGVELRHSVFPTVFRLIDYTDNLPLPLEATAPVDSGTTQQFIAHAFRWTAPEIGTEPDSTSQIQFDGVSGLLQPYLRGANLTSEPIEVTMRIVAVDTRTNTVAQMLDVYHAQMRGAQTNSTTIAGRFGYTNPANQAFPSEEYTPASNPGL